MTAHPAHRTPYVGEGRDGAQRSAEIDATEADGLEVSDPRYTELLASQGRWRAQALLLQNRPSWTSPPLASTYMLLPESGDQLYCLGEHTGGHDIGLNLMVGGWTSRIAQHVRHALNHVVAISEDAPPYSREARRARQYEVWKATAEQLCDRADLAAPAPIEVTDAEWLALIECVLDAAEYMVSNNYAGDADFPDDQLAAAVFTNVHGRPDAFGLNTCWKNR